MPIYEYECQACGHRFEEWQKMSDKPVEVCPACTAHEVQKLISHTSFQLKGGGWYSDLYSSKKPGTGGSSQTGSGTAESASAKTESSATSEKPSSTTSGGESKSKKGTPKVAA